MLSLFSIGFHAIYSWFTRLWQSVLSLYFHMQHQNHKFNHVKIYLCRSFFVCILMKSILFLCFVEQTYFIWKLVGKTIYFKNLVGACKCRYYIIDVVFANVINIDCCFRWVKIFGDAKWITVLLNQQAALFSWFVTLINSNITHIWNVIGFGFTIVLLQSNGPFIEYKQ